jgi:hypothetical protein
MGMGVGIEWQIGTIEWQLRTELEMWLRELLLLRLEYTGDQMTMVLSCY